MHCKKKNKN